MGKDIPVNFDNETEIKEFLLNAHERYYFELKTASNLPKSFWESYSAFCNTAGGLIILAVVYKLSKCQIRKAAINGVLAAFRVIT